MKVRQAMDTDIDAMSRLLDQLFTIERDFEPDTGRQLRGLGMLLADRNNRSALAFYRSQGWMVTDLIGLRKQ